MTSNLKNDYFVPTNDYVFKRIFGHVGNEEITKELLNSILETKVESVNLEGNTILEKDLMDDKMGILDIKAVLNNNVMCDIEMQVLNQESIEKRLLFYWSKMYLSGIKSGEDYDVLKKSIVVLFAKFDIENLKEITKGHTEWKLREKDFTKIVLTEVCEVHIIEIEKIKRLMKNGKLLKWVNFLLSPEKLGELEMENNGIKKAKEEFDAIKQDEYEQRMAELRMKNIRDQKSIEKYGYNRGKAEGREQGLKEGEERGRKQGLDEGRKEGEQAEKEKIAKEMLKDGIDIETIKKYTGLLNVEIEKL